MRITEIQRFCMHDGPGIRTTVFLKGCPLRCRWCHNPETNQSNMELLFYETKCIQCRACLACPHAVHRFYETASGDVVHRLDRNRCILCETCIDLCPTKALQRCGKDRTVEEILQVIRKDRAFYGENGGVTLSGGEPFAQAKEALELLSACKREGISTVVETCGFFSPSILPQAVSCTDLFLFDVKDTDENRHKQNTGQSLKPILSNLQEIDRLGGKLRLRCILIRGINDDPHHWETIARIAQSLRHCEGVEILPYHGYGGNKATFLGLSDNGRSDWIPEKDLQEDVRRQLLSSGVSVLS